MTYVKVRLFIGLLVTLGIASWSVAEDLSGQELYVRCDEGDSRLSIVNGDWVPAQLQNEYKRFDTNGLVVYSEEDERGFVSRTGVKTREQQCGELTLRVTGSFFNVNPQGKMGALEVFLAEIRRGAAVVAGPLAIGECTLSEPRFNLPAKCPDGWAVEVDVSRDPGVGKRSFSAYIRRVNDEYPR